MTRLIRMSADSKGLLRQLEEVWPKGIRYAVATAMTWTAKGAAAAFQRIINTAVDRPTPLTQRASRFRPATTDRTEYDVYIQDEASKGTPPSKYLRALVRGGYRANKRSETLLRAKGILPPGWQLEPGADMPEDQYGNFRGGGARMVQILSGLQAFQERGHLMNRTAGSLARRGGALKEFFVLWNVKTRTPEGIYTRKGKRGVAQLFKLTPKRARYQRILPFEKTIEKVWFGSFERYFKEALDRMLSKAYRR